MTLNAVIIEDELPNLENLLGLLRDWCPDVRVVASAGTVATGIEAIQKHSPALVFLDIQLQEGTGFDVLKAFDTADFEVIFITAYDQYGIQAIKFAALDYLLKPVDIPELQTAVGKAQDRIGARQKNEQLEHLIRMIRVPGNDQPRLALPTLQETRYVRVEEIIRCEASDNYTRFYLKQEAPVVVAKTLKEYVGLLKDYDFHRVHQSHLVNFRYVKSLLREDGGVLLLEDGTKVPVSRQHMEAVKQVLNRLP
ncbi:LytR/AlgR family response regulator transcription factor [Paraflavitalea pollutisoli]|uniref:LytR/AlgR family response regulator transcription factor n=1 Tax=Paraflavitalea pollutisoli TaxID=3034143 RepID=UPI0023ED3036|nr:LytTR family DNA-binding domain-containing protein [Paraflavitalea sp. H1-2-19X]